MTFINSFCVVLIWSQTTSRSVSHVLSATRRKLPLPLRPRKWHKAGSWRRGVATYANGLNCEVTLPDKLSSAGHEVNCSEWHVGGGYWSLFHYSQTFCVALSAAPLHLGTIPFLYPVVPKLFLLAPPSWVTFILVLKQRGDAAISWAKRNYRNLVCRKTEKWREVKSGRPVRLLHEQLDPLLQALVGRVVLKGGLPPLSPP